MLAQFSIIPIGKGESLGDTIAGVIKVVEASGLPYKLNPMGTVLEGRWDEVMDTVRKCHEYVMDGSQRAVTNISIDDRKGAQNRIEEKVRSVERRLGKDLNK